VSEDQRASVLWDAPFILLVLDDSRQQQLEYSNAAASRLFGRSYLDLFGTAGHELVAPEAQVRGGCVACGFRCADVTLMCGIVWRLCLLFSLLPSLLPCLLAILNHPTFLNHFQTG